MMTTFANSIHWENEAAVAVVDDARSLTYGQLREAAERIASLLQEQHGGGRFILLKATPTADFVATFLGIMFSGNTPIPVDPELPGESIEYIRQKSGAVAVIDPLCSSDYDKHPQQDYQASHIPAVIMFTSGTSGVPKGVVISHKNLLHVCHEVSGYLQYSRHPSAAIVLPLHYSYALLSQLCCMLHVGGTIRLFSTFRNPLQVARTITEGQLETFCGVPSTYRALELVRKMTPLSLPTIRIACTAGAAMTSSLFSTMREIFPNAVCFNNYGMTEAAPRISYIRDDDPLFLEPTCGRPIGGVEVKVIDQSTNAELSEGERGVLVVRGPNITEGYLNDADLTKQSFTADGFLISGDVAYLENGYIFICGRSDDIFNVGGEKVSPLEIERVLDRMEPIDQSAVRGIHDEVRGTIPVAFVRLNRAVERKQILNQLDGQLLKSKIPYRFFEVSSFPMTANGKLSRRQLSIDDPTRVIKEIV